MFSTTAYLFQDQFSFCQVPVGVVKFNPRVRVSFEEPVELVQVMLVDVAVGQFGFVPQLLAGVLAIQRQRHRRHSRICNNNQHPSSAMAFRSTRALPLAELMNVYLSQRGAHVELIILARDSNLGDVTMKQKMRASGRPLSTG
jgi:hypothetical protein